MVLLGTLRSLRPSNNQSRWKILYYSGDDKHGLDPAFYAYDESNKKRERELRLPKGSFLFPPNNRYAIDPITAAEFCNSYKGGTDWIADRPASNGFEVLITCADPISSMLRLKTIISRQDRANTKSLIRKYDFYEGKAFSVTSESAVNSARLTQSISGVFESPSNLAAPDATIIQSSIEIENGATLVLRFGVPPHQRISLGQLVVPSPSLPSIEVDSEEIATACDLLNALEGEITGKLCLGPEMVLLLRSRFDEFSTRAAVALPLTVKRK